MKIFEKTREKIGRWSLRKKMKSASRKRVVHNFDTASSAGILFDASDSESFMHIKEFKKFLNQKEIGTELIGFINAPEIPDDLMLWDQVNVLRPHDLDVLFRPKNNNAINFIEKDFDLLFDLSMHDYFTIDFITTLSKASFKVGRYRTKENDYDLMIDIHKEPEVKFLVEQIKNYVSILNNSKS